MRARPAWGMLSVFGALAACAGSDAAAIMHLPDWTGPAVTCTHHLDGSLGIEMTVPTGGHQLALGAVTRDGSAARVRVEYAPPTGDMVPQVITTLRLEVPAERLGDATAVLVEVCAADVDRPQLAVATARPVR